MIELHETYDPQMKVVLDSVNPEGIRLTTLQWRHPRMIHADFLTHRALSRNGRSSRAVPVVTLLDEAARNPYMPYFMANQPGMVAMEEMSVVDRRHAEEIWEYMVSACLYGVRKLAELKVHKQWANRPLEWFGYIEVLVTATDWENFLVLRQDDGAQPELRVAANAVRKALDESTPIPLKPGQWHLPYIQGQDWEDGYAHLYQPKRIASHDAVLDLMKKISAARCARLTIKPFNGDGSFEKELERYDSLVTSKPVHASPVEHQATPDEWIPIDPSWMLDEGCYANPKLHGNYRGWVQARKTIDGEYVRG